MSASIPGQRAPHSTALALPYWVREFSQIRLAAICCAGALGIGLAAVLASSWSLQEAGQQQAQAQRARDRAYTRFDQVATEKQEIRNFQPQYLVLRSKGLIGDENRLDWVDRIRQIQERRKLLPLSYDIEPQQAVQLQGQVARADYELRASRMSLHMDLLHEGDLFNFLQDLRQRHYFALEECSLKRMVGAQNVAATASVAADCKLNWLTLAPVSGAPTAAHLKGTP